MLFLMRVTQTTYSSRGQPPWGLSIPKIVLLSFRFHANLVLKLGWCSVMGFKIPRGLLLKQVASGCGEVRWKQDIFPSQLHFPCWADAVLFTAGHAWELWMSQLYGNFCTFLSSLSKEITYHLCPLSHLIQECSSVSVPQSTANTHFHSVVSQLIVA